MLRKVLLFAALVLVESMTDDERIECKRDLLRNSQLEELAEAKFLTADLEGKIGFEMKYLTGRNR